MTYDEIVDEIKFIRQRTFWLCRQPKDIDGILLRRDDRDECGVLSRRIEELETMLVNL